MARKRGGGAGDGNMKTVMNWSIGLAGIALLGLIMLILFGNLSGNVGFAANTQGANNTDNFIGNYTQSVLNTGQQFPTVGTIIGVALLLFILISLLIFALVKLGKIGGASSSGGNFGWFLKLNS
ncbi:hypothetical protein LCGC14_3064650 [marine sediment metagenome]|uniref:Uncharacterized protein n=1 Tax=marine sediment metagenome TaxID=412755 RepID=A0A0F8XWA5_9ZZZZ